MKQNIFRRRQLMWFYVLGIFVVIGGVMSFGLIGALFGLIKTEDAVSMVYVIIPMSFVMYAMIRYVIRHLEKHLEPLLTGIHRVAEGDFSMQLNLSGADEYTLVYQEFNSMVKEIEASRTEMENFTNEFTHEFKTPITSIKGFADLLLESNEEVTEEERREYLQIISDQAGRLSHLSQNALLLSKIEATQILTEKSEFSLSEQIEKAAVLLLKQMDEKNITLDIPEDADLHFTGNEELMEQVWINLLGNAVKFTPENGTVTVEERESEDEIRISIRDSGPGMTEEVMAHIFEKYYRYDKGSMIKGNGIGLAIVHRITELSGGRIEVESTPGEGSTFTVVLPR